MAYPPSGTTLPIVPAVTVETHFLLRLHPSHREAVLIRSEFSNGLEGGGAKKKRKRKVTEEED